MRCKKERIVLDAVVRFMIKKWLFSVELENGHCMKASASGGSGQVFDLNEGCRVKVETTPCDMSFGRIVAAEPEERKP